MSEANNPTPPILPILNEGDNAPDFSLPADNGQTVTLSALKGEKVVLYFYPKDNTPGCTKQAIGFSETLDAFKAQGATIIGMSPDSATKHDKFKTKHDLTITLAADEEKTTLEAYGVWVEKSMYGKKYIGVERSTFIIDQEGKIAKIWRKVKVSGHIETVLETLKTL